MTEDLTVTAEYRDAVWELIGTRFYREGVMIPAYYGLVKYQGDYYYVNDGGNIVRSTSKYLTKTNGLCFANGDPIPNAYFDFDADGKMIVYEGVVGNKFYVHGVMLPAYYGLVRWQGNYYYVNDNADIVRSKNKYLTKTNNLTFANGDPIPNKYFDFDADGKMIVYEGIVGNKYYLHGVAVPAYYGLVEWQGDYYYVNDNGNIVKNKSKYLTNTNDLTFPDGTPIPNAYFNFDADGKMIID